LAKKAHKNYMYTILNSNSKSPYLCKFSMWSTCWHQN